MSSAILDKKYTLTLKYKDGSTILRTNISLLSIGSPIRLEGMRPIHFEVQPELTESEVAYIRPEVQCSPHQMVFINGDKVSTRNSFSEHYNIK